MMGFGSMGLFGFGSIFMFLFWGLIIWAVFALMRQGGCGHSGDSHNKSDGEKSSLDTLKERYAKGEIAKEEFERIKKDILA